MEAAIVCESSQWGRGKHSGRAKSSLTMLPWDSIAYSSVLCTIPKHFYNILQNFIEHPRQTMIRALDIYRVACLVRLCRSIRSTT